MSCSFYKDAHGVYRVRALERLGWLDHGFGSRASGHWVHANLVTLRQIHSDICICPDGDPGTAGEGDALISNTPGQFVGIRTADCIPILIADEARRTVAAVHAGWRGAAARIAVKAVKALGTRFSSRPSDLLAAIGPGICGRCYTVGPEVARQFAPWFPDLRGITGSITVDLAEANRLQLIEAGVPPERIFMAGLCTSCRPDEFFSYRRSREESGRMLSAIAVRGHPQSRA